MLTFGKLYFWPSFHSNGMDSWRLKQKFDIEICKKDAPKLWLDFASTLHPGCNRHHRDYETFLGSKSKPSFVTVNLGGG